MTVDPAALPAGTADALDRLLARLPAHLLARDAEADGVLRALLTAVAGELDVLETDVAALSDAWFAETCAEWLLPYLAELVGVPDLPPHLGEGTSLRAYVANTVAYRRRKGTAPVLEQVARDVTGWPARAVEMFRLLVTTAHVNHVRGDRPVVVEARRAAVVELAALGAAAPRSHAGGLDPLAHTVDVRRVASGRGRYGLRHVAVFRYPLQVTALGAPGEAGAVRGDDGWPQARPAGQDFTVDPLGRDVPLFAPVEGEDAVEGIDRVATEADLPVPLRPRRLLALLRAARAAGDPPAALPLGVRVDDGTALDPARIRVCGLEDLAKREGHQVLEGHQVMVDPAAGRLRVYRNGAAVVPADVTVWVRHARGAVADVGAGGYDRTAGVARALAADPFAGTGPHHVLDVRVDLPPVGDRQASIADALARLKLEWAAPGAAPAGGTYVVAVGDSATHPGDLDVAVPAATRLVLLAAGRPDGTLPSGQRPDPVPDGRRPHVRGSLRVTGGPGASVVVDGIVLEGDLVVEPGRLGSLSVSQSTVTGVVHVRAGAGGGNGDLVVSVDRAVLGGIACKEAVRSLTVVDAIVDAAGGPAVTAPGSPLCARGATVRGTVLVRTLEASDCVLDGTVTATHRQAGCLRFSVVGPGSRTPRRFRCVDGGRHTPAYASTDPGSPVYLALAATCSAAIRTGGEFEAEMGVHHHLRRPPREAAAVRALAPYAPVQLEIGTFGS